MENSCNKRVRKRDLRDSSIRHFGQTITSTDWTEIFEIPDPNLKYRRFNEVVSAMMDCFFPNKPTSVRESDKPWMTSSLKSYISKRQKSLHKYGRNSQAYTVDFGATKFNGMLKWHVESTMQISCRS
jgi:hypothetical protein